MKLKLLNFILLIAVSACSESQKPHIVMIVGDDIGWNDVSLHGSDLIMTPNIDMIGLQGITLMDYYSDTQGTPARGSMFTGKYSMKTGTQGISIGASEDRGLPVSEKLLPSYLKDLGYVTHLIGKWHLGMSRKHYLPNNRGFDHFYGFLGGSVDYYTYNHIESCNESVYFGLDFFENLEPAHNASGHLTNVLTERAVEVIKEHEPSSPLYLHMAHGAGHAGGGLVSVQAPTETAAANDHIAHSARRLYAGLVTSVDRSVGQIIAALAEKDMLNNTIIIYVSDNGAAPIGWTQNFGSNLPLRGTKATPWEGAVRTPAVLWHASIKSKIWEGLFHVTDWLPTLVSAAGGTIDGVIDGVNQWDAMISHDVVEPPRVEAIIAVDDLNEWGAFRDGDLKIIVGDVNKCTSEYYGLEFNKLRHKAPSYNDSLLNADITLIFKNLLNIDIDINSILEKRSKCSFQDRINLVNNSMLCMPSKAKGCLFNITADPEEAHDLWDLYPDIVQEMSVRFRLLWSDLAPRTSPTFDNRSDPSLHDYVWYPWVDDNEINKTQMLASPKFPLELSMVELQYYIGLNENVFKKKLNDYFRSMTDTFMDSVSKFFS